MKKISVNKKQGVFVIPCGDNGFTCLGFKVLEKRLKGLAAELDYAIKAKSNSSLKMYNEYQSLINIARAKNIATGWRSQSELIPEFIGHEGRRVEVVTSWGEKQRYIIGKSTGFIPCHLEIKQKNSSGGGSVCGHPFQSIKFLT